MVMQAQGSTWRPASASHRSHLFALCVHKLAGACTIYTLGLAKEPLSALDIESSLIQRLCMHVDVTQQIIRMDRCNSKNVV